LVFAQKPKQYRDKSKNYCEYEKESYHKNYYKMDFEISFLLNKIRKGEAEFFLVVES